MSNVRKSIENEYDEVNFSSLPEEIILMILVRLNLDPKELCAMSLVSRLFCRLASDNALWKCFFASDVKLNSSDYKGLFKKSPAVVLKPYLRFSTFGVTHEIKETLSEIMTLEDRICCGFPEHLSKFVLDKSPYPTKHKKIFFLPIGPRECDFKKLNEMISQCPMEVLSLWKEMLNLVRSKKAANALPAMHDVYLKLFSLFKNLRDTEGFTAAMFAPACFRKILNFIGDKDTHLSQVELFSDLLHQGYRSDIGEKLPALIDNMIAWLIEHKNRASNVVLCQNKETLDEILKEISTIHNRLR